MTYHAIAAVAINSPWARPSTFCAFSIASRRLWLRTRKYTDKDGVEKFATDIRVDQMQMLGGRQGMGGPAQHDDGGGYDEPARRAAPAPMAPRAPAAAAQRPAAAPRAASGFDDMDDDIPF